ncbi:uncharacterized protein [Solanum tuberosum]|uniref:Uncharacterized protein n=2 Tax=Solanum tuberosum TaxID=4113 RepID=M1D0V5_SOLTU|nr:PREDICTED: uncharacterized protein LOC102586868 isoform X1 [Solanum tuberosum]KAH0652267.1 hypothetical protein KY289_029945 [Solanum tuberosum]KAH0654896.1 hypothetical protein KY285_029778 [Solanum tuberosum]
MKQVLLLSLLLFSTLVYEAQSRNIPMLKQENGDVGEVNIICKDDHCSSSGRNRKLMTKTTSTSSPITTTTSTENIKNEGNKAHDTTILKGQSSSENFSINSSPETGHRKTSSDHHPDVLDLAGMDYSPAKRKPPIHN